MTDTFEYTQLVGLDSTALDIAAYNENDEELYVRFSKGGEYAYSDVPKKVFTELGDAWSAGSYYRNNILGKYTSTALDDTSLEPVEYEEDKGDVAQDNQNVFAKIGRTAVSFNKDGASTEKSIMVSLSSAGKVSAGNLFTSPTNRYCIQWENHDSTVGGAPEFVAEDEAHALAQFQSAMSAAVLLDLGYSDYKVKAVTHYFD